MNSRPKSKDALEGQWLLPLGAPLHHAKRAEYRRCGDNSCSTCREGRGPDWGADSLWCCLPPNFPAFRGPPA